MTQSQNYEWFVAVLSDLIHFAQENGMTQTEDDLRAALQSALREAPCSVGINSGAVVRLPRV